MKGYRIRTKSLNLTYDALYFLALSVANIPTVREGSVVTRRGQLISPLSCMPSFLCREIPVAGQGSTLGLLLMLSANYASSSVVLDAHYWSVTSL